MEVEKVCNVCSLAQPLKNYRKYSENSFSVTCKKCLNELDKARKIRKRQNRLETFTAACERCSQDKPLKQFARLKKFYKKRICTSCYPFFLREQKNEWCRNESISNVNYRLKKSLAARLRKVLLNKGDTTLNYIGCNISYFREWMEYNFSPEMTWDNYGSYWSIDHVIPVNKFNMELKDHPYKCWNWSNLMPVTVAYNLSKKDTINMEQVDYILKKLQKFKEEGSTTKWFSEEWLLNKELANSF